MPIPLIAGAVANGIVGMGVAKMNDSRQLKQQESLQELGIQGQKQLNAYNTAQQMKMWKDTNYSAQKKEMEKAGLNPGLMYGMGGGGGTTTGSQGSSINQGQAPAGGGEVQAMGMMGAQMAMMEAQKENIKADTELKKVDAEKKSGVDTEEAKGRIGIMAVDKILKEIEVGVQGATADDRIDRISYDTRRALVELDRETTNQGINKETVDAQIKTIEATAIGAVLKNGLTKAQTEGARSAINVNNAQIEKWGQEIAQNWENLNRQERELMLKKFTEEIKAQNQGIQNVMGGQLQRLIENVDDIMHETRHRRRTYTAEGVKK